MGAEVGVDAKAKNGTKTPKWNLLLDQLYASRQRRGREKEEVLGGGERWREGASREKKVGKKTIKTKKTKGEQGEYEEKFFSVRSGECCRESQEGERQRQRERDSLKEKRKWRAAMKRYKEQDVHTRM